MKCALVILAACGAPARIVPASVSSSATIPHARIDQIVELGDTVYLFEPDTIAIVRNGLVVTSAAIPPEPAPAGSAPWPAGHLWSSATTIPALDGDGRWVVATRSDGSLLRVISSGETETIGDRLGLRDARVRSIVASGSTVALRLDDATAVTTDGIHLQRFPITGELAITHDRLAIATDHAIEVWDLAHGTRITFAIDHAHPAFLDAPGAASRGPAVARLIATTERGLWIEDHGKLVAIRVPARTFSTAVAGSRLWVRAGDLLYTLEHDHLRKTSAHVDVEPDPVLIGSPTGDIWINTVGGSDHAFVGKDLRRFSFDHPTADPRWTAEVAPVFQRVCSHCHLPGGDADVDLSTPATWAAARAEIVRRVLVTHTMPPAGTELSDADRHALEGWLNVK